MRLNSKNKKVKKVKTLKKNILAKKCKNCTKNNRYGKGIFTRKTLSVSNKSFEEERLSMIPQQKKDYEKCIKNIKGTDKIICKQFENLLNEYFKCIDAYQSLYKDNNHLNDDYVKLELELSGLREINKILMIHLFEIINDPKIKSDIKKEIDLLDNYLHNSNNKEKLESMKERINKIIELNN